MFFRDKQAESERSLPLLPLRDMVVFPHTPVSLVVGRPRSLAAVAAARTQKVDLVVVAQRDPADADPGPEDLYTVGTLCVIEQTLRLPDGNVKVLLEGKRRVRIDRYTENTAFLEVVVSSGEPVEAPPESGVLVRTVHAAFERYAKLNRAVPPEMLLQVNATDDPDRLADMLVASLQLKLPERQELLEVFAPHARLERVYKALLAEIEFAQVERKLKTRVRRDKETGQREQWLQDQMKAIQRELGDRDAKGEMEELAQQLAAAQLPDPIRDRAEKELRKLSQMNLMSAEATVVRNYLDWVLALPWTARSGPAPSLEQAAAILAEDHYGLTKVKERVLEYLAVSHLVDRQRGPILCLVGPPGVGKTSLARSVARALAAPFVRISLGGVRDEAEIRGHRRTYIGAMPGKLLHAMKRAGTVDPVLLLDEIDKMSSDFRGDPAAALLEVLDPEQNHAFNDHYLDLDYDLSRVAFLCTANSLQGIPAPLQDRLEIVEIPGYTEAEKSSIARRYLIPKQRALHGLTEDQVQISSAAVQRIVRDYTKESGVREVERQIASICRKVARRVVHYGPQTTIKVTTHTLDALLGPPKFRDRSQESSDQVGVVNGLAVSPWGGELLQIEAAAVAGKGQLILTGRLGDWLKESATAGFTYLRSRADALGLEADFYEKEDVHVHYPGNALRTDGPSAGVAMAVAMVSALTGIPARHDVAMTGEITLRGRVLRIGGLKEKVLAAHRGGVRVVLIPHDNLRDVDDIPAAIRADVEIVPVTHMDAVLKRALASDKVGASLDLGDDGRHEGPSAAAHTD